MINISVTLRDGSQSSIAAESGISVMEALRNNGVEELLALCGGCCSCATCHVYVESGPTSLNSPVSEDEDDLLNSSSHRRENSRLACQIRLSDQITGLSVRIAPED